MNLTTTPVYNMVKAVVCLAPVAPIIFGVRNKWIAGEYLCFFHSIQVGASVSPLRGCSTVLEDRLDAT